MNLDNQVFWAQRIEKKEQDRMWIAAQYPASLLCGASTGNLFPDRDYFHVTEILLENDVNCLRQEYARRAAIAPPSNFCHLIGIVYG